MQTRPTSRLVLGLSAFAILVGGSIGTVNAYPPGGGDQQALQRLQQQLRQQLQRQVQQRQQYEQRLRQAIQQRNQQVVKQLQEQAKKQAEAYRDQIKKMQESGMTAEDIRNLQREQILASIPRSQQSALKRKWAREDGIRKRAIERARRSGKPVPADTGELDLGGLEDLKLDE